MPNKISRAISTLFGEAQKRSAEVVVENAGISNNAILKDREPDWVDSTDLSLTIAAVYRCVTMITQSVACLPLRIEKKRGAIFEEEGGDLAYLLAVEPNEWTNAFDFWRQAVQNKLLEGEALIIPQYNDFSGALDRLVLATPGTGGLAEKLGVYYISDHAQGINGTFMEDELILLRGLSIDGINSTSIRHFARAAMTLAHTAEQNTLTQFANGGAPMGMVTNEKGVPGYGEYTKDALKALARDMNESFNRGDRIIAVSGKAAYQNFAMTAADMQSLEQRKFSVRDICRFFGVDPSFVFDDAPSNYKSAEMANVAFLSHTLNPILKQIEIELQRKLLRRKDYGKKRFHFDREEIYATDLTSRINYIDKRIQTGTSTINEARISLGKAPVEGGDTPLVSANLRTIEQIREGSATLNEEPNEEPNKEDK